MPAKKSANGEGSIYRRADGRFVGSLTYLDPTTGARKRRDMYGKSRLEVRKKLRAAQQRADVGSPVRDATSTVSDWCAQWCDTTLRASSRRLTTQATDRGLLATHVCSTDIGTVPLDRLRPSHIDALILDMRQRGRSSATVRKSSTSCGLHSAVPFVASSSRATLPTM